MAEVRLEIELPHPRERVWRALTDARFLSEWLMPTDLSACEGAEFTLEPGTLPGFLGPVSGEVTELAPPDRLVMLWRGEKLHTRVVWELTESDPGCTLQVVQTGFIGAPATLRRRALRDTYTRLFAEQLPATLDRLAAVPLDLGSPVEVNRPVVPAAVPKQRRAPGNMAVGAWAAGRTLGAPADGESTDASLPSAGSPPAPALPRPRPSGEGESPASPDEDSAREPEPRSRPAWHDRLGSAPAWVRAVAVGAAAAVLAVAVFAAVAYTPGSDVGGDGPGTGPEADRDAPGVALQPGGVTSHTSPAETADPETTGPPGEAPGPSQSGAAGAPGTLPGGGGLPEVTAAPSVTVAEPAPVLTAQMTTSGRLLGLTGRAVTVTVSNPGPGSVSEWEVTMNVGDQEVTNVSGAAYQRDGSEASFTSVDAELMAGGSTQFSFDLPGLLGASDPTGCAIGGNPCD